jgi:sulfopyruvate decarboxylase alpha subunit
MAARKKESWPADIFRALQQADVRQVVYVPDAGHKWLIDRCERDNKIRAVPLTSEVEGAAVLAGAWLGGERGVLLMQSSGVGNCINMMSIIQECRFPLLTLVTMRGDWGEFNPWQIPMGQAVEPVLEAAGVIVHRVDEAARIGETVAAATYMAFDAMQSVAVVIGQRVVGFKQWGK